MGWEATCTTTGLTAASCHRTQEYPQLSYAVAELQRLQVAECDCTGPLDLLPTGCHRTAKESRLLVDEK